jgi:lipid A ethanolaminephosphotransferase
MVRADDKSTAVRKSLCNPLTLAVLGALWIASFGNWPLWRVLLALPEMSTARGGLFIAGAFIIIVAVNAGLLALFAWRRTIKPVLTFFLVSVACGAYFMGSYGVVLDPTMLANMLQTNMSEARDLMNMPLGVSLLLLAGLPLWFVWRLPMARRPMTAQLGLNAGAIILAIVAISIVVFGLFADLAATMRNHKSMRYMINPVNSFYSLAVAVKGAESKPTGPLETVGADAVKRPLPAGAKPPLLLLTIGETARAGNFSLNGYERPTNSELSRLGVTSFTQVTSCGTNTAASLPCMFSSVGRVAFRAQTNERENLLDVLQRAGMAVLWIDNQAGCKGVCDRVAHAQTTDPAPGGTPLPAGLCEDGDCLDDALLYDLDRRIAALPAERRAVGVVVVMHQMGSHGPAYYRRSPRDRKPFLPECTTNVLQQCDPQQLVNAYDNSIAYTDHVLAASIAWLKSQNHSYEPSLIYVSDHGESLGERNIYLHGMPFSVAPAVQTHVPMIVWGEDSPGGRVPRTCLDALRNVPLTHDNLFHTVLGLLDVQTSVYQSTLDAFAECQRLARG